ncbi:claudin-4-like [Oreochromis aureus]|uniref:claudin-4-like n=1 Tax=Oreochromis aureus TaxID=47969 RepID=UPI001952BF4B|nr:claudin-4-like [Oreochromis aureus]
MCLMWDTGKMECEIYLDFAMMPEAMNAARALVIIAIIVGVFGILLGVTGNKRTNFMSDDGQKSKVAFGSGLLFIIAGFLVLTPVCWIANISVRESYKMDRQVSSMNPGASLYIGWFTAGLLFPQE